MIPDLESSLLAEVKRIELRSKRKMDADLIGQYRTAFRGSGLVPSDIREYQPGDDVKHIHWKATARSGRVYVKSYEEDRQLNILLLVDESASLNTGGAKKKARQAIELSALLVLLAERTQDAIGFASFSNHLSALLPPSRKRSQVSTIIYKLLSMNPTIRETDLASSIRELRVRLRRRSIIFIVSDFFTPPFTHELKLLALRHDVICAAIENQADQVPPANAIVTFQDAETGKILRLDTGSRRTKEFMKSSNMKRIQELRRSIEDSGADFISVAQNPIRSLSELMERRTKRLR